MVEVTEEGGWVDRGGAFIEHYDTNIISNKSLPLPLDVQMNKLALEGRSVSTCCPNLSVTDWKGK